MSDDKAPSPGRCWYNQGLTEFSDDKAPSGISWNILEQQQRVFPQNSFSIREFDSTEINQDRAAKQKASRDQEEAQAIRRMALEAALRCWQPNMTAAVVIAQAREFEAYLTEDSPGAPDVL